MGGEHYDIIIVGSGPGGAAVAWRLAQTGKRILIVERGGYVRREPKNWNSQEVIVNSCYVAERTWRGRDGKEFRPRMHSYVGGNSKFYGGSLFRLREQDFGEIRHADGVSPAWPVGYDEFEPYYQRAEELYHVHGRRGEDPTEPRASGPYAFLPVAHEPRIQEIADGLAREGLHPFHLPLGVRLHEKEGRALPSSPCIKCESMNGFPCPTNGKADAQVMCIDPALRDCPNLTLSTGTEVERLVTDANGRSVKGVAGTRAGEPFEATADIVVVACGALLSALLLLRSTSDQHPGGLGNGSGQVGRNYLRQNDTVIPAISREPNPTRFQKTLGVNDYYLDNPDKEDDFPFPLGGIQMFGKLDGVQMRGQGLPKLLHWVPEAPFDLVADHCVGFQCFTEDLPRAENRVYFKDDGVRLDVADTNLEAHKHLIRKLRTMCDRLSLDSHIVQRTWYTSRTFALDGTTHQAGTVRFGDDARSSVLDRNCKAHELDNLYVTDSGFFPSVGAVNPTLTIVANALRVADHIASRMGARDVIAPPLIEDGPIPSQAGNAPVPHAAATSMVTS